MLQPSSTKEQAIVLGVPSTFSNKTFSSVFYVKQSLKQRIDAFWTVPQSSERTVPEADLWHAKRRISYESVINTAAWPLALFLLAHVVGILAIRGSVTDDFSTVYYALRRFIEGTPVYNEVYEWVDPHYLYNPGATLLLSPLAFTSHFGIARVMFICLNTFSIIAGLAVMTRLVGFSLRTFIWPVAVSLALLTEGVRNTLIFVNINGVLFFMLTIFYAALIRRKWWLAGLALGFAILIKPLFAPLVVLPLMLWHLRTVILALAIPVVMNLIAWPIIPGADLYITRVTPYLSEVRDYANSSLRGLSTYFGISPTLTAVVWVVLAAFVAVGVLGLAMFRHSNPLMWATTTGSLLIAGVCLLSSLGQMYYSILLFPLLFTAFLPRHAMYHPMIWAGVILCLSPLWWESHYAVDLTRWFSLFHSTFGWAIIVTSIGTTACLWAREGLATRAHAKQQQPQSAPATTATAAH